MNNLLNNITWRFIKEGTGKAQPSIRSYLQSISEIIDAVSPKSRTDERRLEIAKNHLLEVKRNVNRLEEKNTFLQEQLSELEEKVKILEEEKSKVLEQRG
jgi:chromosome segregation ATPase